MKRLGLVLGSGGARGVAHIGFLQALDENGIKPDCIAGCSMGSVVGGLYCKGMSPDEMHRIVNKLKALDLVDLNLTANWNKSLLKTQKMAKLLDTYFDGVKFEDLKIPFMCNAFDINKGKTIWFSKGEVSPCVRASSSIPLIFNPVEMGNKTLVDGGVVCRMPYEATKRMGAEVIVGVDVLGKIRKPSKEKSILTFLRHTVQMLDAVDWHNTEQSYKANNYDLLIMPELGNMNQYLVKNLEFAYEKGYEAGKANIEKIKELII